MYINGILSRAASEIHTCDAAIETIEVFFARNRSRQQLRRLKHCASNAILTPCKGKNGVARVTSDAISPLLSVLQTLDVLTHRVSGTPYGPMSSSPIRAAI